MTTDAVTNVITDISASAKSNISTTHISDRAAISASWINTASGTIDVSFNFNNGAERKFLFDASNAAANLSSNVNLNQRLGYQIMMIAAHAFTVRQPANATEVFALAALQSGATEIESAIANSVSLALSAKPCQQAILDKIISNTGPIVSGPATGTLTYNATMSPLNFTIICDNIKLNISLPVGQRTLTLRNIKFRITLIP